MKYENPVITTIKIEDIIKTSENLKDTVNDKSAVDIGGKDGRGLFSWE